MPHSTASRRSRSPGRGTQSRRRSRRLRPGTQAAGHHGGIKKKTTSVNGFLEGPQPPSALQKNITTDMSFADMKAIYDWGKNPLNTSIVKLALTAPSPGTEGNLPRFGNRGMVPTSRKGVPTTRASA